MNSGQLNVSAAVLILISLFLVYVPVCLFAYWQLIPRLSSVAKRLASAMLVGQILVIVAWLGFQSSSSVDRWLWDIKSEWNIPATLASTQLALAGGVALMTAVLAQKLPAWRRLYLVGVGLVFLLLGLDEYLTFHEGSPNWERYYTALGVALVVVTMLVAARSPQRLWMWHSCFLAGLAGSAAGGILLEVLPSICGNLGFLHFDKCLSSFHWEEFLEFLGIWLTLVAILGLYSDAMPRPSPCVRRIMYALPVLWILLLFLNSRVPSLELQFLAQSSSVKFESGVQLRGYHIVYGEEGVEVQLYAVTKRWKYVGRGYSAHLVDQVSGKSVASQNEWTKRQSNFWLLAPNDSPVFRHDMQIGIPPQIPSNRALWIVLSLWREKDGDFMMQEILASDHQLLSDTQVVLGELVIPKATASTVAGAVPIAVFDRGFALDTADMPTQAQTGEPLLFTFSWRSDVQGRGDYIQFLHFVHEESGTWWGYDQQPLGPRLPTRLWYSGLADSETWQIPQPSDLAPGHYSVFTGLYNARDQERVPSSDATGIRYRDARVPLGSLVIE